MEHTNHRGRARWGFVASRALHYGAVAAVTFAVLGCAAIFNDTKETVQIATTPPGAQIAVNGAPVGQAPLAVQLDVERDHIIQASMPGCMPAQVAVDSSLGAGWLIADLFLSGLVGIVVDAATKSWNELSTNSVLINLQCGGAQPQPAVYGVRFRTEPGDVLEAYSVEDIEAPMAAVALSKEAPASCREMALVSANGKVAAVETRRVDGRWVGAFPLQALQEWAAQDDARFDECGRLQKVSRQERAKVRRFAEERLAHR